ncbi:MAG: M56 family metallopeptidase [Saccharofermentanales bacterium]
MRDFLNEFIGWSLSMSFIALVFIMLNSFSSKKYTAKYRYIAGLIVFAGLIVPFRPNLGFILNKVTTSPGLYNIAYNIKGLRNSLMYQLTFMNDIYTPNQIPVQNLKPGIFSGLLNAFAALDMSKIIIFLWITGMLMSILYRIICYYRFNSRIKRWSKPYKENQAREIVQGLCDEMGIRRHIDIMKCPTMLITTPILKGITKPIILIPDIAMTSQELYLILKHELVHYKFKDHYLKFIIMIGVCLHWFNPVIYILSKSISLLCEQSCDEKVLGKESFEQRKLYSQLLVTISARCNKQSFALSTNFYGGKEDMKKRLTTIFDLSSKKRGTVILLSFFLITIMSGAAQVIAEVNNSYIPANVSLNNEFIVPELTKSPDGKYEYPSYIPNRIDKVTYGISDSRHFYLDYGTYFDSETGLWSYQGKPIFIFDDGMRGGFIDISKNVIDNGIVVVVVRSQTGEFVQLEVLNAEESLNLFHNKWPEGSSAKGISEYVEQVLNDKIR